MFHFELLAKLVHHIQQSLIPLYLLFAYVYSFNVLTKLYWPMNLKLLVSYQHSRGLLESFWSFECRLQLVVVHFVHHFETELQRCDAWISTTWIFISKSTSISYMRFQQKVWKSVRICAFYTFWIIGKVDNTIFDSFEICRFIVILIEHSIFPSGSWRPRKRPWAFVSFKLTSVMGVFQEKLHVFAHMNLDDDWGIVFNVKLQVF